MRCQEVTAPVDDAPRVTHPWGTFVSPGAEGTSASSIRVPKSDRLGDSFEACSRTWIDRG